jgi:5-methylcytosine-specific restriction endonuclease McrA
MPDVTPDPKARTLARGERRYRRKIASPKQWQAIQNEKQGPCRVCGEPPPNELHHLLSRAALGDDEADNLVPLCAVCHDRVTCRDAAALELLAESLSDAEWNYWKAS